MFFHLERMFWTNLTFTSTIKIGWVNNELVSDEALLFFWGLWKRTGSKKTRWTLCRVLCCHNSQTSSYHSYLWMMLEYFVFVFFSMMKLLSLCQKNSKLFCIKKHSRFLTLVKKFSRSKSKNVLTIKISNI